MTLHVKLFGKAENRLMAFTYRLTSFGLLVIFVQRLTTSTITENNKKKHIWIQIRRWSHFREKAYAVNTMTEQPEINTQGDL